MAIPSQGLFRVYARSVSEIVSGNFAQTSVGAPPPITTQNAMSAYYLAGIDDPATAPRLHQSVLIGGNYVPAVGTYELALFPKNEVEFDTLGTPTTFSILSSSFPQGAAFSQLRVWINGNLVTGGRDKYLNNYKLKARGSTVLDVNPPNNISGDTTIASNEFGPNQFQTYWGVTQVFGSVMGFAATIAAVVDATALTPNLRVDLIWIDGVYVLNYFNIANEPQNAGPLGEVSINGDHLDVLDTFTISWYDAAAPADEWVDPMIPNIVGGIPVPPNNIVNHTITNLTIRIPELWWNGFTWNNVPPGGVPLFIFASQSYATSFTGSVLLQQVNTQLVDGSGIYALVPGKANDTYYDRSSGVSTIDLKIPDPFARTGFFKG